LLFCFCFVDPAGAQSSWPEKPPPEFTGPYTGDLTIKRVPLAEMPSHCRNLKVRGCAYWSREALVYCTVWIPSDVSPQLEAAILEHELGHCNGWKHWYPGQPAAEIKGLYPDDKSIEEAARRKALENPVCQQQPKPEACP
jgi:hypothetical protein